MNELTGTLGANEWDYIGKLLLKQPYGEVVNIVSKLNGQFAAQQQKPEAAEEKKDG